MKNRDVANIWNKHFLDAPYSVGKNSKEDGYDCCSAVFSFYEKIGINITSFIYNGAEINRNNYLNFWNGSKEDTILLKIWAESLGKEIKSSFRQTGDLFICYFDNSNQYFLSIYLGNNLCSLISSRSNKVKTCPYDMMKNKIYKMIRIES